MTFLNQFHKEAMERTMRKIEESKKSPMNSKDFADYMRRNLEQMDNVFDLGTPGPSGNENDTYVAKDTVFKVNNLLNSGSIHNLLDKIILHNLVFPNTAYKLIGFAGYDGRSVMPVLEQERICNAQPATQIMIDTYMSALGFTKENNEGRYANGTYVVWDVVPRNVLVDADGDMYVVDAEIKEMRSQSDCDTL